VLARTGRHGAPDPAGVPGPRLSRAPVRDDRPPARQLLREVWGPDRAGDSGALRVCVKGLRDKLEPDPRRPKFLVTERASATGCDQVTGRGMMPVSGYKPSFIDHAGEGLVAERQVDRSIGTARSKFMRRSSRVTKFASSSGPWRRSHGIGTVKCARRQALSVVIRIPVHVHGTFGAAFAALCSRAASGYRFRSRFAGTPGQVAHADRWLIRSDNLSKTQCPRVLEAVGEQAGDEVLAVSDGYCNAASRVS